LIIPSNLQAGKAFLQLFAQKSNANSTRNYNRL